MSLKKFMTPREYRGPAIRECIDITDSEKEIIAILRLLERNMRRNVIGLIKELGKLDRP